MEQEILGLISPTNAAATVSSATFLTLLIREFREMLTKKSLINDQKESKKEILDAILAGQETLRVLIKEEAADFGGAADKYAPVLYEIRDKLRELRKWHDVEDEDGAKIWYTKASSTRAVEKMAAILNNQTNLLSIFHEKQQDNDFKIKQLMSQLRKD